VRTNSPYTQLLSSPPDEVPTPCLHVLFPQRPSAHAAAASLAESDDEVPIPRILLWFCVIVMMRFLFHIHSFIVPPSLPVSLFVLILPLRLVVMADALFGMANIDFLLLFLLLLLRQPAVPQAAIPGDRI
jgi:hypothetical protein